MTVVEFQTAAKESSLNLTQQSSDLMWARNESKKILLSPQQKEYHMKIVTIVEFQSAANENSLKIPTQSSSL